MVNNYWGVSTRTPGADCGDDDSANKVWGTGCGTETYKRNRRNSQVAIEPISSKYHLKQVGKRCERPGLAEGTTTGVKSGRGWGRQRERERERKLDRESSQALRQIS